MRNAEACKAHKCDNGMHRNLHNVRDVGIGVVVARRGLRMGNANWHLVRGEVAPES